MKNYFIITILTLILNTNAYSTHKPEEQYFSGNNYSVPGSDNYQKLETELVDNKLSQYVQKQLDNRDKTGLVNYLLYENGKIVINKKNYNDVIKKNKNVLRSNSMGKSMISYVTGHAVCKYGIDLNTKMNDWAVLNNTLYADNTLSQVLNMTSGDHNYIGEKKFKGDGYFKGNKKKVINNKTVFDSMQWFQGTKKKKENSPYNYSAMSTHVAINYVIHKVGTENYQKLLKEIFTDHVGVKDTVYFDKVKGDVRIKNPVSMWAEGKKWKWVSNPEHGNQRYTFWAKSEDYLRVAKTIMNDYHSDSCIGDYLRNIYDNRVDKKKKQDDTKSVFAYTKQYGGQFHMSLKGTENVIFAMDGYAGQQVLIDMTSGRIVIVHTIDRHYNWQKIVYNVMKN
jgi:CubicO group peptidase (beta-lactamase class C family)